MTRSTEKAVTTAQVVTALARTDLAHPLTERALPTSKVADALAAALSRDPARATSALWRAATDPAEHPADAVRVLLTDSQGRITQILTRTADGQTVFNPPALAGQYDLIVRLNRNGQPWQSGQAIDARADVGEWVVAARTLADWFEEAADAQQAHEDRQAAAAQRAAEEYGASFDQIRGLLHAAGITLDRPDRNTFYQAAFPKPGDPADQLPATSAVIALRDDEIHRLAAKLAELGITPMAADPDHTDENGLNP